MTWITYSKIEVGNQVKLVSDDGSGIWLNRKKAESSPRPFVTIASIDKVAKTNHAGREYTLTVLVTTDGQRISGLSMNAKALVIR